MKDRKRGQTSANPGASATSSSETPWTARARSLIGPSGRTRVPKVSTTSPSLTRAAPMSTISQRSGFRSVVSRSNVT